MGKRSKRNKRKNKKVKKNYNKKEFCEVFCQTCLICTGRVDPSFCYSGLYKHEPKPFINKVFNNLIDIHAAYQAMGRSIKSVSIEQFQNIVCRTGICFNGDVFASAECNEVKDCYRRFTCQLGLTGNYIIHEKDLTNIIDFKNNKSNKRYISFNKKKKRRDKRYVCKPYATFFSRDNLEFQEEIRKILYGDSDNKQDKDQELSASDPGEADRHIEGGKPKV